MAGGELIDFHLSGASSAGGAQTDPELSLGNHRSSSTFHEFESTVTTSQTATTRGFLIDSARTEADDTHRFKWIVIVTGPASLQFARITGNDGATGTLTLDRPTTANAASGDFYRIYDKHSFWDTVSGAECSTGIVTYRILYIRNTTGVSMTQTRFYLTYSDPGGATFDIIPATTVDGPVLTLTNEFDDPLDSDGYVDPNSKFAGAPKFVRPFQSSAAEPQGVSVSVGNNQDLAVILKRTVPKDAERRRFAAAMLVCETTTATEDPNPLTSACMIVYDLEGYTPVVAIQEDRFPHIRGGARLTGTLTASETTLPVFDRDVNFTASPLGSIILDSTNPRTDVDGEAGATFISSTSPGDEGSTSSLKFIVGNGEET